MELIKLNNIITYKTLIISAVFSFTWLTGKSQESIQSAIKNSTLNGYFRSYYMHSINEDSLQDWNSLAVGGKLGFETGSYRGFYAGAAFYATINTGVGNVSTLDQTTGKGSRYVLGNYDVLNPSDREIYQLGEAYIGYKNNGNSIELGRFKRATPLINHQDGRMIPTLLQGVWYTNNRLKKWQFDAAVLNAILPRSTNEWQSIESSLVYVQGLSATGGSSNYLGNLNSNFIAIGHLNGKLLNHISLDVWNYFADNIFNTTVSEIAYTDSLKTWQFKLAGQQIHQARVNNGGNEDLSKSYFQTKQSNVYGARLEIRNSKYIFGLNATHISDEGRFLFPREWGREFLYTFQKRERQEGSQNVFSYKVDASRKKLFKNNDVINLIAGAGFYNRPEATDQARNKFAVPANTQFDLDFFYHFNGSIPGLTLEALFVYKPAIGDTYNNPNYVLNKVNLINYQFILNYRL